jgi:hypothetical protein
LPGLGERQFEHAQRRVPQPVARVVDRGKDEVIVTVAVRIVNQQRLDCARVPVLFEHAAAACAEQRHL